MLPKAILLIEIAFSTNNPEKLIKLVKGRMNMIRLVTNQDLEAYLCANFFASCESWGSCKKNISEVWI